MDPIYQKIVRAEPAVLRGEFVCSDCGTEVKVDSIEMLKSAESLDYVKYKWPRCACCGETMSVKGTDKREPA